MLMHAVVNIFDVNMPDQLSSRSAQAERLFPAMGSAASRLSCRQVVA
jgi:hypothetical protein